MLISQRLMSLLLAVSAVTGCSAFGSNHPTGSNHPANTHSPTVEPSMHQTNVSSHHVKPNVSYQSVTQQPFKVADHLIAYGSNETQYGLYWQPDIPKSNRPLVVFIHGGCWLSEYNIEHSYALASAIAERGYPVWSIEYRRTGKTGGGWPVTYQDIIKGIAAAEQLGSYNTDLTSADITRIALIGHSAGGHLALLAGGNWNSTPALANLPFSLAGTIGLAAITDIEEYAKGTNSCETATPQFMGGDAAQLPEAYQQANPAAITHWQQTWLLHGTADTFVATEQAKLNGATTLMLKEAGHFDWIHPQTEAFATLMRTLEGL